MGEAAAEAGEEVTRLIGGVEYGDVAFEHMREISAQLTLDGDLDDELKNEAAVIHEFHVQFPGAQMKAARG